MPLSRTLALLLISGKTTLFDVVDLLTKYKMLALLPTIRQSLVQLSKAKDGDETIVIQSPFELSLDSVATIKKIVGETEAKHRVIVNKNVLAGFKAKHKGIVYDGSAERIIKQLLN